MLINALSSRSVMPSATAPAGGVRGSDLVAFSAAPVPRVSVPQQPQSAQPSASLAAVPSTTAVPLKETVQELQKILQQSAPGLELSIDKDSGEVVIKLVDTETKEVVRQFPSEEMLQVSKAIREMQGLLVSKKV